MLDTEADKSSGVGCRRGDHVESGRVARRWISNLIPLGSRKNRRIRFRPRGQERLDRSDQGLRAPGCLLQLGQRTAKPVGLQIAVLIEQADEGGDVEGLFSNLVFRNGYSGRHGRGFVRVREAQTFWNRKS